MASGSAIGPVQQALYAVLAADATLLALATGGVWNDVPANTAFPHVLISRPTQTARNTFGGPTEGIGRNVIARTHVYSRYQGDKESTDIENRIVALVDFQPIAVAGYSQVSWEYLGGRPMVESINKIETRHLVSEFRVLVHQ